MKRSQRAEILENNQSILEALYTDPFDGDYVLKQMLNDQTTLLIGRKGTGKSTIINRFQQEIRKSKDKISLYLDVRTIFSKSSNSNEQFNLENALSCEWQLKLNIYKTFIKKVIEEIYSEINKNLFDNNNKSWGQKFKNMLTWRSIQSEIDFKKQLDSLLKISLENSFADITDTKTPSVSSQIDSSLCKENGGSVDGIISIKPEVKINDASKTIINDKTSEVINYSAVLKRKFHISNFSDSLKKLLASIGINKVYFCLDDSSELDKDALDTFITTLVSPLNNDSEGYFRFKIAFYPERNTLPEIDRSKIDTIHLDYYDMYQASGADKVEDQAISYIKRLIRGRIGHYFKTSNVEEIENIIFDVKANTVEYYYKLIFYACSSIPRNIGRLLFYANKRSVSQGKPINKVIIQEAAQEQYINDVQPIINRKEFFQYKSYSESFTRLQLKDLVSKIVAKAKVNKQHIGESQSKVFEPYTTSNAPSQFLYLSKGEISNFVSTLEINFFITKVFEQADKGKTINKQYVPSDVIVYTINYGLCKMENIVFEEVKDRKYRIERVFNFDKLIQSWATNAASISCIKCGAEYDISEWERIQEFDCYCKQCKLPNVCELKAKFESNDQQVVSSENTHNLKAEQLKIIHSLYIENDLTENKIAEEMDVSQETIRAYLRGDRVLINDNWIKKNNKKFQITSKSLKLIYS